MQSNSRHFFVTVLAAVGFYLLAFSPLTLYAAHGLILQWDANDPAPDDYRLYRRLEGQTFDYNAPIWIGQATEHTIDSLTPGNTYYFVVRATKDGDESGDSNIVMYAMAPVDGEGEGSEAPPDVNPPVDDDAPDSGGDDSGHSDEPDADDDLAPGGDTPPDRPVLLPTTPFIGNKVSLTPWLKVDVPSHRAHDIHGQITYQISTTADASLPNFKSFVVFERTFSHHFTRFQVPALILDPDETYYWRVRFLDHAGSVAEWSDWGSFTTIDQEAAGIIDGILNDQRIVHWNVLSGQELEIALEAGLQGVNTTDAFIPQMAVRQIDGHGTVVALRALNGEDLPPAANQPDSLAGVLSFKLHLEGDDPTAVVQVYFSQPAPSDAQWYHYDPDQGWIVYPYAVLSADRRSVTLEMEDGGTGDLDGVENGVIVVSSGLGFGTLNVGAVDYTMDPGSAGACFLNTSMQSVQGDKVPGPAAATLFIASLLGLMAVMRHKILRDAKKRLNEGRQAALIIDAAVGCAAAP